MFLKHVFVISTVLVLCLLTQKAVVLCEDEDNDNAYADADANATRAATGISTSNNTNDETTTDDRSASQELAGDNDAPLTSSTQTPTARSASDYETTNMYEEPRPQLRNIKSLDDHCVENYCYNFNFERLDEVAFFDIKAEVRINHADATYDIINAYNWETLIFENSTFARFPLHLFYTVGVHELDMRNCSIQVVTWECFLMAQNLRVLLLSQNRLRTIEGSTFKFAADLQYLFLDTNHLQQLHEDSFEGLSNLRYLDLSNNQLKELPQGVFDPLSALEELHLNNNHLRVITDNLFPNNLNLKILRVSANRLQEIDESAFRRQTNLIILDLEYNPQLRTLVLQLQLHNLIATHCALTRINIYGYVRNVDLSYNHILELYFAQPEQLESLNLRNNSLQQIASLTRAIKLETLDLGDNPDLQSLPSPWLVNSLRRLDLGNTGLRQLPVEAVAEQQQLIFLNVSYNRLSEINPFNFKYLTHLNHFDIRGNNWNCYNLNMLMDMLLKPFNIAYGYDQMDPEFPGEYINDIACMYRLESDSVESEAEAEGGEAEGGEEHDTITFSNQPTAEVNEHGIGGKPAQLQTNAQQEVEDLRQELKIIVGFYEQKFQQAFKMIEDLNKRLESFERLNATLFQHVTITV